MIKKIYLDMDGVLADFDKGFKQLHGVYPHEIKKLATQHFWDLIHDSYPRIYSNLPIMDGALELLEFVSDLRVAIEILTAVPRMRDIKYAAQDKYNWLQENLSKYNYPFNIGPWSQDKQHWARPGYVLIDDRKKNIEQWEGRGGIGILHKDTNTTIELLRGLI